METILKGCITEIKCKLYFLELGYVVSVPGKPVRYDFVLDTGNQLLRVQVKSSKVTNGVMVLATNSTHLKNGKWTHQTYGPDEVDFICTWVNEVCYLIPISECTGLKEKRLRFKPAKNGQIKRISLAKDYVAKDVLERLKHDGDR